MLKFSEIFEFSRENSYFERIRMVRMVRMVRSLADRTFQLGAGLEEVVRQAGRARGAEHAADDDDSREGWRLPPGGFRAYIFSDRFSQHLQKNFSIF